MKEPLFNKINEDCSAGSNWTVVLYGSMGTGNVARLHRPGEGWLIY